MLYICGNETIYRSILRNYKRVLANSPAVKFAKRKAKIYVCTLSDLKTDFMNAKFRSLTDEFSWGQLQGETAQNPKVTA